MKKKPKYKTCKECGTTDETVKRRNDPYMEDIYNEIVRVTWCDICERLAADEI